MKPAAALVLLLVLAAGCNDGRVDGSTADALPMDVVPDPAIGEPIELPADIGPPLGEQIPSELEPAPRAVFDTVVAVDGRLAVLWTYREGTQFCEECVGVEERCADECRHDTLMLSYVDDRGAPIEEFIVSAGHPETSGSGIGGGAVAVHPDGFAIGWQLCTPRGSCAARLRTFSPQGEPRSDLIHLYEARLGTLSIAAHAPTGHVLAVSSRPRFGGREAAVGVGAAVYLPIESLVLVEWRMLGSPNAGMAAVASDEHGFWVAYSDPEPGRPDPTCPFCEALPCVRESCDQRSTESMDVVAKQILADGSEGFGFEVIREPGGDPVPIWDDLDVSVNGRGPVVSGVVGWGAQTEGLVNPADMGVWNPGVTISQLNALAGRGLGSVDLLSELSGVAFGANLDPTSPSRRWVLHDSVVAPGGLDEAVIGFRSATERHSETRLTNAFTERGTVSFVGPENARFAVGFARELLDDTPSFTFYRAPL